ncbi:hypothetical protein K438DRAFT_1974679 [Mycena galopus ATCC 62051]|nr:hypothetical protein K438DRAFT_1974679 [Mycena galopus ATCC 62051]
MSEALVSPPPMEGIPMFRNDSAESTESVDSTETPFGSALNTPADEHTLSFDAIDAKLLAVPHVREALERLEGHGRRMLEPAKSPRRVSLSRQFSRAMEEANKSTSSNGSLFRARSNSVERVFNYEHSALPAVPHSSPNLSFPSSPELPAPIERPIQTPEPTLSGIYTTSSLQPISRTTRPPLLRRDSNSIFLPAMKPAAFEAEDEENSKYDVEFTPRAHSTLRHRKNASLFTRLNDSITGEPAFDLLMGAATPEVDINKVYRTEVLARPSTSYTRADDSDFDLEDRDAVLIPQLSLLFPLQLVLFPVWCVLVGGAILLCPTYLHAIAFPASALRLNTATNTNSASTLLSRLYTHLLSLLRTLLVHLLPFATPLSPIRVFAHWAAVAHLHVAIFGAALGALAWVHPPSGVLVAAAVGVGGVRAWGDFEFGLAFSVVNSGKGHREDQEEAEESEGEGEEADVRQELELGGDVRQMLYQVLLASASGPGCGFGIEDGDTVRTDGEKWFLVRIRPRKNEEQREEERRELLRAAGVGSEDEGGSGSGEDDD